MSITAIMPAGVITSTVYGLHQWDYGQELRIVAEGLPGMIEVHFACPGMDEAPVRVAEVNQGEAIVTIPDKCLEQSAPIKAWVYVKKEASGRTALEITLPIIARAKPAAVIDTGVEAQAGTKYDDLFALTEKVLDEYEKLNLDTTTVVENAKAAAVSATNASASETNAATSATNASASETNAATSASEAAKSATNASASETNAATSASEAAASATKAEGAATKASGLVELIGHPLGLSETVQEVAIGTASLSVTLPSENAMVHLSLRSSDDTKVLSLGVVHFIPGISSLNSAVGLVYESGIERQFFAKFDKYASSAANSYTAYVYMKAGSTADWYKGTGTYTKLVIHVLGYKEVTE